MAAAGPAVATCTAADPRITKAAADSEVSQRRPAKGFRIVYSYRNGPRRSGRKETGAGRLGSAHSPLRARAPMGAGRGVAGAAFVVGASLVSRTVPYGRRGVALGVFTLGSVFAVVISAVSRGVDPDGRRAALVLGGLLMGFAGLAALVLRDEVAVRPATQRGTGAVVRQCVGQ